MNVPCPVCLHAKVMDARLWDRLADLSAVPEMKWHNVPRRNLFNTADTLIRRHVALSVARLDQGFGNAKHVAQNSTGAMRSFCLILC